MLASPVAALPLAALQQSRYPHSDEWLFPGPRRLPRLNVVATHTAATSGTSSSKGITHERHFRRH